MAESESGQEKTEQATPKKLEKQMESGQFARSKEVNTLGLIIGAMLVLTIMAPKMVETLQFFMSSIFQKCLSSIFHPVYTLWPIRVIPWR